MLSTCKHSPNTQKCFNLLKYDKSIYFLAHVSTFTWSYRCNIHLNGFQNVKSFSTTFQLPLTSFVTWKGHVICQYSHHLDNHYLFPRIPAEASHQIYTVALQQLIPFGKQANNTAQNKSYMNDDTSWWCLLFSPRVANQFKPKQWK